MRIKEQLKSVMFKEPPSTASPWAGMANLPVEQPTKFELGFPIWAEFFGLDRARAEAKGRPGA
jgi:hypothetical protein